MRADQKESSSRDHRNLTADQLGCQDRQSIFPRCTFLDEIHRAALEKKEP
jgi:hypothetical protein